MVVSVCPAPALAVCSTQVPLRRNPVVSHLVDWRIFAVTCLIAACSVAGHAQNQPQQRLVVDAFTSARGIDVPAEYVAGLQKATIEDLQKLRKFEVVSQPGSADAMNGDLHLTCTITKFHAGNRAKRLFSTQFGRAAGVGATRMATRVQLFNGKDSPALLDKEVDGAQKGTSNLNPVASFAGSKSVVGIEAKAITKEVDSATKR